MPRPLLTVYLLQGSQWQSLNWLQRGILNCVKNHVFCNDEHSPTALLFLDDIFPPNPDVRKKKKKKDFRLIFLSHWQDIYIRFYNFYSFLKFPTFSFLYLHSNSFSFFWLNFLFSPSLPFCKNFLPRCLFSMYSFSFSRVLSYFCCILKHL